MTESAVVFSRRVSVAALPSGGNVETITASPDECRELARKLKLPSIESLSASFTVLPLSGAMVLVRGRVQAAFHQVCVVTLDPFASTMSEPVDMRFAPPEKAATLAAAAEDDLEAEDPPDPYENDEIDLGAIAAEFFALGLDPYPRKPGAVFTYEEEGEGKPSPFAKLAALKTPPN